MKTIARDSKPLFFNDIRKPRELKNNYSYLVAFCKTCADARSILGR